MVATVPTVGRLTSRGPDAPLWANVDRRYGATSASYDDTTPMEARPVPLIDYLRDGLGDQGRAKKDRTSRHYQRMGVLIAGMTNSLHVGPYPTRRFASDEYVYYTVSTEKLDEKQRALVIDPPAGVYAFPADRVSYATQVPTETTRKLLYPLHPSNPPLGVDKLAVELIDRLAPRFFAGESPDAVALAHFATYMRNRPAVLLELGRHAAPDFFDWCGLLPQQDERPSGTTTGASYIPMVS
jgi:hypothetical protein